MLTKIFPTGIGEGYGPVEYLCSSTPFGKNAREKPPQVLSGDPVMIRHQIDAVPFKFKYTSGVHSFAPEDRPTDEQILEVIEATEELAFAGLPSSSRSILWVKHEHAGRVELHFLIPRQEVNSGKSFNAFPPSWQKKYDPLRDKFNYKYGWARPDDPERARHWQPGINAKILADAKRQNKPNPKSEVFRLTDDLANMAMQKKLTNRAEIVSELRKRGYGINRQGKDYLTIVDQAGKKTRLKGTLFAENFYGPDWIKAEKAKFDKPDSEKILADPKLAEEADAKLQAAIRKAAVYNSNRYSIRGQNDEQSAGKQSSTKSALDAGNLGKSVGSHSGKPASFQKPDNSQRNESQALYSEPGLGEGATTGNISPLWENVGDSLRESPLPDPSPSALGRSMGQGSEMAESHRGAIELLYGRRDTDSPNNLGTGSGDYRRQPRKPGRNDETDYGYSERITRQNGWIGEFRKFIQSISKSSEKLEKRLLALNKPIQQASDFALHLSPGMAAFRKSANQLILELRSFNENYVLHNVTNSIRNPNILKVSTLQTEAEKIVNYLISKDEFRKLDMLNKQLPIFRKIPVNSLAFGGEKVCEFLRKVDEQRVTKKLVDFDTGLKLLPVTNLSTSAYNLVNYLESENETKIVSTINQLWPMNKLPNIADLKINTKKLEYSLAELLDLKMVKKFADAV